MSNEEKYNVIQEVGQEKNHGFFIRLRYIPHKGIGDDVKAGDLGGYVAGEGNLSHEGKAWGYGNAWVFGDVNKVRRAATRRVRRFTKRRITTKETHNERLSLRFALTESIFLVYQADREFVDTFPRRCVPA